MGTLHKGQDFSKKYQKTTPGHLHPQRYWPLFDNYNHLFQEQGNISTDSVKDKDISMPGGCSHIFYILFLILHLLGYLTHDLRETRLAFFGSSHKSTCMGRAIKFQTSRKPLPQNEKILALLHSSQPYTAHHVRRHWATSGRARGTNTTQTLTQPTSHHKSCTSSTTPSLRVPTYC